MKKIIIVATISALFSIGVSAQNKPDSTLTPHQRDSLYRVPYDSLGKKNSNYKNQDKLYPNQWKRNEPLQKDDRDPKKNSEMGDSLNRPRN